MAGRSFSYSDIFPGRTVLVFVPHEDDEINVAGALMAGLRQEGFRVICAFAANGDRSYLAETRISEALQSLAVLGVPAEDAVFLGYPDGGLDAARCVFINGREGVLTVEGRSATYGVEGKPDFAMALRGAHQPYTWRGFLDDVRDLLLHYRPDGIVAVDFDSHPDHRMCSIAVETALGEILNTKGNTWRPVVLKAFAYNTGFESVKDFYGDNLLSTVFNRERIMDETLDTDNPVLEWARRLRLSVPDDCRAPLLWDNRIFHACRAHLSQRAFLRADRIVNGDEVFWLRRTDNLLFEGRVTASSGDSSYLHDFRMVNTRDIRPKHGVVMANCLWVPDADDREKICRCAFDAPCRIEAVSFYGNPNNTGRIAWGRLTFSNGYACDVPALRPFGRETAVPIPPQESVEWVEFRVLETEGEEAGLSEWELFEKKTMPVKVLHILADGNFMYDWTVPAGTSGPEISAYAFGVTGGIRWYWDGEPCTLAEIRARCAAGVRAPHTLRAEADGLASEARLLPVTAWQQMHRRWAVRRDRFRVWWEKQRIKPAHHRLRQLKRKSRKEQK